MLFQTGTNLPGQVLFTIQTLYISVHWRFKRRRKQNEKKLSKITYFADQCFQFYLVRVSKWKLCSDFWLKSITRTNLLEFSFCFFVFSRSILKGPILSRNEIISRFFHLNEICCSILLEQVSFRSQCKNAPGGRT